MGARADIRVVEGSSERMSLPDGCVDIALTDPPYHDDVQYSELSLPLRAWAKHHLDRLAAEALVNDAAEHNNGRHEYRDLLTRIFGETRRTLREDGHLVFSYANREPDAWIALFEALDAAGMRARGYAILHSENETDLAKRGVAACTLDLLMDLVRADTVAAGSFEPWSPTGRALEIERSSQRGNTTEREFLTVVGEQFLEVGQLAGDWQNELRRALRNSEFLRKPHDAARRFRPGAPVE
jgi:hypothetical protein